MKLLVSTLLGLMGISLLAGMALAQPFENSSVIGQVQDRIVITVSEGTKMALDKSGSVATVGVPALDQLSQRFGVRDFDQMHKGNTGNLTDKASASYFDRVWAVDFSQDVDLQSVKKAYEALPEVEEVRLVDICKVYDAYLPNDLPSSQYYLRNLNPGGGDIRAVGAWNQAMGDSNVIVAVLDSGVDWHHPDLGGPHPDKVNGALWTNWEEYYGNPGQDDDGNGKVDDIRGWDFVNLPASQGWPDEDVTTADNDPMDYESHGTNCAGCVAAITNNGIGIAGTAPGCKIMAIRCGWLPNGEDGGVVRMDFASQGMLYAINNGAKIINCSWGSSSYLANAVYAVQNQGGLIITAAGNDNDTEASYLASRSGVLAVAATGQSDAKASFSSYGSWVEISAPGVAIYTTSYNRNTGQSSYSSVQGTSFSSPITAGAAALLWSANPDMTYQQISALLMDSADDIDHVNPAYVGQLGAGRVNMLKALGDDMHRFPSEFPTLYDAMNSAAAGDIVGVEAGTEIPGPITVIGDKDLEILAGYSADYSTRDPVNGKAIVTGTLSDTVLKFVDNVGNGTVLDGFVFSGGGGQNFSGIPFSGRFGGGIILNQVSPTLRNIEITGNSVGSNSQLGCGGGLMMNNSSAVLENVHIHGNTGIFGGGLFANNSTPTIIDCVIENNTLITTNLSDDPKGGGIYAVNSEVTATNLTVDGHEGCHEGGGVYVEQTDGTAALTINGGVISNNTAKNNGGGLFQSGGTTNLDNVEFTANTKTAESTFMNGGGFYITAATANLHGLVCDGNEANAGGGGAINACEDAFLTNSVFSNNSGQFYGGGLYCQNTTTGIISANTFAHNDAPFSGGGGFYVQGGSPDVEYNISAFNTGGASFANGMAFSVAPGNLACNNVFGNATSDYSGVPDPTGTDGNISADPLFCGSGDTFYNLGAGSPCLAENSGSCGLIGALPGGCGEVPVPDPEGQIPSTFRVEQNFPNPFNPKTTIRFSLPTEAQTSVTIYDVAGRKIRTVVDDVLTAQVHDVTWTGDDDKGRKMAAGVYFYLVRSGDHRSVGRMALVK